jgi:hypothetical protein
MSVLRTFRRAAAAAAVALITILAFGGPAFAADKLTLKDGRVVEGTITREGDEFVYITVKIGTLEKQEFYTKDQISKVERDSATADPTKAAATSAKPDVKPAAAGKSNVTRVAILNFGPPSSWMGKVGDMVGVQVAAKAWDEAIPLLEKDGVNVVVVRINSGGGLGMELDRFHKTFEVYKKKFRTVAWVESAISAAAMSPYVLEEFYFMPEGSLGGCTGWSGQYVSVKGVGLEAMLSTMEEASRSAGRDPKIMRSMQIMEPLSANIEDDGTVTWFQNLDGKNVVNPREQVLTFNAEKAMKFKFAKGIAATPDELIKKMGIQEYEIAGDAATRYIDEFMRRTDVTEKKFSERIVKYSMALQTASGIQDRTQRGAEVGRARKLLDEIEKDVERNPNFEFMNPIGELNREWFMIQREQLKLLMR